uniref:GATA transcription factor n=1 Tax=Kalanchoe fedtschenkoi TaxID=63787 RepID=A0A7N0VGS5_KALFE
MGKQGPCCHCGVTSTPLWRNGPADKPVLCNACGSRWRTKGSLTNYTPLHARAEPEDYEINKHPRAKTISINKQKEVKLVKRKQFYETECRSMGGAFSDSRSLSNYMDQDASYRSSSGSAISNSESCGQFSKVEASELTDPDKSIIFDSVVTPKKKIVIPRSKPSPVQKLTRDLCTILHEQQQSYFSGSSEEDLLFNTATPMASMETGHGSVLIRHPSSIGQEEESEASSLTFDNKPCPGLRSCLTPHNLVVNNKIKDSKFQFSGLEKSRKFSDLEMQQEQIKRAKLQNEKLQILGNHNSPLRTVDLKEILNFKEFATHLTTEEHHRLLKYLPPSDIAPFPESLITMFDSAHFVENLSSFQQLLAEGVFDITLSGVKAEDCKTLRRFALSNLTKSKWVEHYNLLKKCRNGFTSSVVPGMHSGVATMNIAKIKRPRDGSDTDLPDAKSAMKCPKRVTLKDMDKNKTALDNTASCFSPKNLFALPPDNSSLALDSFQYADDNAEQEDLLLDVPLSNSFPQAELLHPTSNHGALLTSPCSSSVYPNLIRH